MTFPERPEVTSSKASSKSCIENRWVMTGDTSTWPVARSVEVSSHVRKMVRPVTPNSRASLKITWSVMSRVTGSPGSPSRAMRPPPASIRVPWSMPVGGLHDGRHRIAARRIHHHIRAHLLGQRLAEVVGLHGHHLPGATGPGDAHREQPDGSAPQDHHGGAHHVLRATLDEHRMHGVAEGIVDGGDVRWDPPVHEPRIALRDHDVLREPAVEVHTEDPHLLASVHAAAAALRAEAAEDVTLRRYEGPGCDVVHLGARRHHVPGHLVAE